MTAAESLQFSKPSFQTSEYKALKTIQKIEISKPAGIDRFSGQFLQDGA